jgi:hypothetical protein
MKRAKMPNHLQLLDRCPASAIGARDFNDVKGIRVFKFRSILRFADLVIRAGSRELDLNTYATLEVVQMLTASANEGTMLRSWNLNCQYDTIPEYSHGIFQFCLQFIDKFGFTTEADLIRWFTLTGTDMSISKTDP